MRNEKWPQKAKIYDYLTNISVFLLRCAVVCANIVD